MREVCASSSGCARTPTADCRCPRGKDELAFLFIASRRAGGPLVKIDCATLPADLLEAELFGHEAGAFTGATAAKPGRLEAAHHGTMVLDEIAYLSIGAQAKLLRLIEAREFERLGARRTIKVDARLIALTNVDLEDAVKRGVFREDLFYRLNVVRINVPPLRERRKDVAELARTFLKAFAAKHGRKGQTITRCVCDCCRVTTFPATSASWPIRLSAPLSFLLRNRLTKPITEAMRVAVPRRPGQSRQRWRKSRSST